MKSKKTKLTALLLSALMAVSTISSVTWAADLFSDGSDGTDVTREDTIEIVSEVEDEEVAEDATLNGLSADDFTRVFFYVSNDVVYADFEYTEAGTGKTDKITVKAELSRTVLSQSCFTPHVAVYTASLTVDGVSKTLVVSSDEENNKAVDAPYATVVIDSKTCKKWLDDKVEKDLSTLSELSSSTGYIVDPAASSPKSGKRGHKWVAAGETGAPYVILREATDQVPGKKAYYSGCSECGAIASSASVVGDAKATDWTTGTGNWVDMKALKTQAEKYLSDYLSGSQPSPLTDVQEGYHDLSTIKNGCYVQNIGVNTHVYDTTNPIVLYDYYHFVEGKGWVHDVGDANHPTTYFYYKEYDVEDTDIYSNYEDFRPFNCHWDNGQMVVDDPESSEDAYYYIIVVCKNCKTVKFWDKVYLKDVSGGDEGTFYEKVEDGNIIGFIGKDGFKHYYFSSKEMLNSDHVGDANVVISEKININLIKDPPEPIFKNCGSMGYYYIRSYVKDSNEAVTSERKEVPINHSWGTVEVAPQDTLFTDNSKSQTEDKKLLTKVDEPSLSQDSYSSEKNFVVVRDANKNVVEVKSIDCITTAKYQLCRYCLNCGKALKYGDLQTAGPNKGKHQWGPYSTGTDPEDDEYVIIDKNTHMRYTYVHRICTKCGEREKKISGEYPEAHKFQETRIEDGDKKDPNCGEPGYYTVKLVCKCKLEDDGSEKKEEILPTDKHDFTGSDVKLVIKGSVQIGKNGGFAGEDLPYNVYAEVVRTCTICGKDDSNGINNTPVGKSVGVDEALRIDTKNEGRTVDITEEARKDPNGIPYSCSEGKATITFNWSGKVDGKTVRLAPETVVVPYYPDFASYAARTDHKPVTRTETVKAPTTTQEGSAIEITECSVCGEELSRVDVPIAKLGSAPSVKATTVNYNTVAVTWDAVEGAESYKVYNKSNALGISKWQVVATVNGTSYTDTGLVTGAKYRYTVRPVVGGVSGEYSKKGVVVSPKLTAPEIKSVTSVGANKNKVTWTKVDGASGYIVQRKTSDGSWIRIATVRGGSNINCRDKKAVAGASYRVRAFRTVEKPNFVKSNVYGPFSTAK